MISKRANSIAAAALARAVASAALAVCGASLAQAQDFWAGKQVTYIVGAATGGGYDNLARLTARHLGRHLPGNPTFVVQNMPAGNSVAAANHIYNVAAKDGTAIALLQRGMLLAHLINAGGIQFDVQKLNWLANLNSETGLVLVMANQPHQTAKDLFEKELIIGASAGIDPELSPKMYNALLGTKFKIVTGYRGTTEIGLAMERGEVQGIGDWSLSSLKVQKPQWLAEKKVRILLQGALENDKEIPGVPNALDFVKNDTDRKALQLYFSQKTVARPVVAPPGVPAQRIADWRKAFMALDTDKAFKDEVEKSKMEVSLLPGDAVTKVIDMVASAPPQVRARFIEALKN
ncbi:MAG: Bug family tripartite tricarboxylate transporter substrate binding protein [Beijerinckiaceae bacterium]